MVVLGIDPASIRCGYGYVEMDGAAGRPRYIEAGVLSAQAKLSVYERLAEIGRDLEAMLAESRPDLVVIEHGFVAVIDGKLQQGALVSSAARGVCGYLSARAGILVVEVAPATVKQAVTGKGNADKPTVARMVARLLGLRRALASDAADALAVAIAGGRQGLPAKRSQKAA